MPCGPEWCGLPGSPSLCCSPRPSEQILESHSAGETMGLHPSSIARVLVPPSSPPSPPAPPPPRPPWEPPGCPWTRWRLWERPRSQASPRGVAWAPIGNRRTWNRRRHRLHQTRVGSLFLPRALWAPLASRRHATLPAYTWGQTRIHSPGRRGRPRPHGFRAGVPHLPRQGAGGLRFTDISWGVPSLQVTRETPAWQAVLALARVASGLGVGPCTSRQPGSRQGACPGWGLDPSRGRAGGSLWVFLSNQ